MVGGIGSSQLSVNAERRDDEERAGDHGEHSADDSRPVAPAEVDADLTGGVE